ncbi:NAD(P)-dependent oxidoreductase [Algoriphagus formosus]|uniref:NAD-dependent epimerase/dehydratase family protein n=1 Tax=Algoriphagus formosus TaxID=2007308 RepID=A0A4R5V2W0_9BACT|nr:NAD(P)H-binding protein [Algoriphagus aquimaris]TDK46149.1 NAD-dependent epimerase/dehydratase family protein [Algoriphagus aquimaris]
MRAGGFILSNFIKKQMKSTNTIAVIGGTGKSGTYLVKELLRRNYKVKLLVRNPEKKPQENPNLQVVLGDVKDPKSIHQLLQGVEMLISNLGLGIPASPRTIFSETTASIIQKVSDRKSFRYILLSGLQVDAKGDKKGQFAQYATEYMRKSFPISTQDKQEECDLLDKSRLNWTIVRSSMIDLTSDEREYAVSTSDCKGQKISASSLAQFMVDQLESEKFSKKAPFIWDK